MKKVILKKALLLIRKRVSQTEIQKPIIWAVVGSTASFLEGQKIVPSDVDIVTTKNGILLFEKIFKEFTTKGVRFDDSEKGSSWYLKLNLFGIDVEIMGDLTIKGDKDQIKINRNSLIWKHIKNIPLNNGAVPIFPVEWQVVTNAISANRLPVLIDKIKFMKRKGYQKKLIEELIKENNLSETTVRRLSCQI